MRIRLFFLVLCFNTLTCFAQRDDSSTQEATFDLEEFSIEPDGTAVESDHSLISPEALETTRSYQAEKVLIRKFDEQKWKAIVGDVDYNEKAIDEPVPQERAAAWGGPLLKLISYIVIIALVLLLIYYVTKNTYLEMKIRRTKVDAVDMEKPVENIETLDIEDLLTRALRDGNYKLAIRLYYLNLLKRLNELGVITWKKDKTNHDYLFELFSRDFYYEEMQKLTRSYEEVWYGEHILRPESFQQLTSRFEAVYQEISTAGK